MTSTFSRASSRSSAATLRRVGTIDGLGKLHPWLKRLGQRAAATPSSGNVHSPTGLAPLRQAGYSGEPRLERGPGGGGWIPSWPLKKNSSTRRSSGSSAPSTAAVSSFEPDRSSGKYSPQPCTVTLILRGNVVPSSAMYWAMSARRVSSSISPWAEIPFWVRKACVRDSSSSTPALGTTGCGALLSTCRSIATSSLAPQRFASATSES